MLYCMSASPACVTSKCNVMVCRSKGLCRQTHACVCLLLYTNMVHLHAMLPIECAFALQHASAMLADNDRTKSPENKAIVELLESQ